MSSRGRGRETKSGTLGENQSHESASTATDLRQLAMARRARDRKPQESGAPLDEQNRARMEGQLGGDLSGVRIHTGGESARAADDLNARAFTSGKDIHFGDGEFQPGTREGDRLLAHELSHAVHGTQAAIAREAKPGAADAEGVSKPGDADEKKADQEAGAAADGLHGGGAAPGSNGGPEVIKGTTGIITKGGLSVNVDDKQQDMNPGTVVEVEAIQGDQLLVKVWSGMKGTQTTIPRDHFKPEPGVTTGADDKPRDDVYADFGGGALWDKASGPTASDVDQGFIGDCYLNAAMMSVVTANPGAIKKAFSPQDPGAKNYTITLYKKNESGNLEAVSMSVDTMLPADRNSTQGANPDPTLVYTGQGKDKSQVKLWPALMEKAYAQLVGGYARAGGGGYAGDAMEAITGQKADALDKPAQDSVIERFKQLKQEGKAVVCGTLGSKEKKQQKAFTDDEGAYSAQLTTNEGTPANIVKSSLHINDESSWWPYEARDDGAGKISGMSVVDGKVTYPTGEVVLTFEEDEAPQKAEDLTAHFEYRGFLDKELNVHAWHMYVFEDIDGDNLKFKNPWGVQDPKPIPAAKFLELFNTITSESVPKEDEPPPGGK
jgi:hypothetical protein